MRPPLALPEPFPSASRPLIDARLMLMKITEMPNGTIPELRYRERVQWYLRRYVLEYQQWHHRHDKQVHKLLGENLGAIKLLKQKQREERQRPAIE